MTLPTTKPAAGPSCRAVGGPCATSGCPAECMERAVEIPIPQATWHPGTRPEPSSLLPEPGTRWLGLEVKHAMEDGDTATVEFVARFKVGGRPAVRLHERSRFVREGGRWRYVDGSFPA